MLCKFPDRDATQAFDRVGHSQEVADMLGNSEADSDSTDDLPSLIFCPLTSFSRIWG